jgi:threonylcarbamoyladenosine tRNA methylthiotransferase MtaB
MCSRPQKDVVAEAGNLARSGYKEIVLTGIRVGRYVDGGANLTDLLESLSEIDGIERLRLSSIEMTDIPSGLLELMAGNSRVCRHLHIPLQSGDDEVLARMNRPYTSAQFEGFVEKARTVVPEIGITTDIMVGFPGETREQFDRTFALTERLQFSLSHIFRFSPRRGTVAAEMRGHVSASEKESRSARLIALAAKHSHEFASRLIGSTVRVVVESKEIAVKVRSGLTDNYVRVTMEAGEDLIGEVVPVRVHSVSESAARGVVEI